MYSKQTDNEGGIYEREFVEILNSYGTLSTEETSILDKKLTTNDGKYKIAVSEIYNGEFLQEEKTIEFYLYERVGFNYTLEAKQGEKWGEWLIRHKQSSEEEIGDALVRIARDIPEDWETSDTVISFSPHWDEEYFLIGPDNRYVGWNDVINSGSSGYGLVNPNYYEEEGVVVGGLYTGTGIWWQ